MRPKAAAPMVSVTVQAPGPAVAFVAPPLALAMASCSDEASTVVFAGMVLGSMKIARTTPPERTGKEEPEPLTSEPFGAVMVAVTVGSVSGERDWSEYEIEKKT